MIEESIAVMLDKNYVKHFWDPEAWNYVGKASAKDHCDLCDFVPEFHECTKCRCHGRPFYQADADRLKYTEQRVAELEAEVAELRHGAS